MANIHDYLIWRGDLSFDEHPFNDVDNLVLSAFAYLDFTGIIPTEEQGDSIELRHACNELLTQSKGDVTPYVRSLAKVDTRFVKLIRKSPRFASARLSAYVDVVDKDRSLQFSAMQIDLCGGGAFIAFRGTDTTLVGWQENFMISFKVTDAQEEAARYVERAIGRLAQSDKDIRIGGHSKGGNLAEYAAANCPEHLRQRIACVYSNDGPGMAPEVMQQSPREILGDRLRIIVPSFDVIGMIFSRKNEKRAIVASTASGFEQHDITTWQILPSAIEEAEGLDPDCIPLNQTIASWTKSIPLNERERVTNEVFQALRVGGAKTFDQIMSSPANLQKVLRALGTTDERTRSVVMDLVQRIIDSSVVAARSAVKKSFEDAKQRFARGAKPHRASAVAE